MKGIYYPYSVLILVILEYTLRVKEKFWILLESQWS